MAMVMVRNMVMAMVNIMVMDTAMGMATVMATEASPDRKRNRKSWGKLTNFVKQIQEQAQQIILLCLFSLSNNPHFQ